MSLDIHTLPSEAQNILRVALNGRLDTHTYQQLDDRLATLLAEGANTLVLELGNLAYISSAGIRSIVKARKALATRGGKVLLAHPQPQVKKVFDVVRAAPLNEIFTSVAELDAYLDAMQQKVLRGED